MAANKSPKRPSKLNFTSMLSVLSTLLPVKAKPEQAKKRKHIEPPMLPSYIKLSDGIFGDEINDFTDDDMETLFLLISEKLIYLIKYFVDSLGMKLIKYTQSSHNPLHVTYKFGTHNRSDLFVLKINNGTIIYRTNIYSLTYIKLKELYENAYISSIDEINDEKSLQEFLDE
jgi:hypothetical protein